MTPRQAPRASVASMEARAKLNLFLRITGRSANGYHDLATLFQRVALADTVRVAITDGARTLDCDAPDAGPVERNLGWRAALAFIEATGWPSGFSIRIEKRIPIGGGMGGGSADAAAVLLLLNFLAPRPLDLDPLLELGGRLGADVPFLVLGHPTALGTGNGSVLLPVLPLAERPVVLTLPGLPISSGAAFGWYAADRGERPYAPLPSPLAYPPRWEEVERQAINDLEPPVLSRHPALEQERRALEAAGARIARMTGSGSTLFGVFDDLATAERAVAAASPGAPRLLTRTVSDVARIAVIA